jgi:hypothetical protein
VDRPAAPRVAAAGLIDAEADAEEQPAPGDADSVIDVLLVRQAFQRLSGDHREVLALVDIAGFSYDEAAELLDVPKGTVMSRISRARAAMAATAERRPGNPLPPPDGARAMTRPPIDDIALNAYVDGELPPAEAAALARRAAASPTWPCGSRGSIASRRRSPVLSMRRPCPPRIA